MTLTVVVGPVSSGKSSDLIRRVRRLLIAGKRPAVFKPSIDSRYAQDAVVSHDGLMVPCRHIQDPNEAFPGPDDYPDAIFLDEVQFFAEVPLLEVVSHLRDIDIPIVAYGLDMDARGEPFGPVPKLLALADEVVKLKAVCQMCGADAGYTKRLTPWPGEGNVAVGGLNDYEARCYRCR